MMSIYDIINKVASMNPYKVPGDRESYSQYREGWQDALGQLEAEVEKAVVSTHDPIAGAIGSVAYDKLRIITESGYLVANVRVFDLVQSVEGIFQDDFGQWIADAINEKIGGKNAFDSDWISPIPEERAMQEAKLKALFPSYPTGGVKWQYMNGLLELAMKQTS